ncbi:MAG: hypothetical protein M0R18_13650 [Deltaproteobacteria bacterium]|nr:hypothetical protein [Deltaproteobacteria bacterium]
MISFKRCKRLILVLILAPTLLFGFDFPGYATYHGKVIDADTLKPIEGAIVYAIWIKCRPGIGSGSCGPGKVKEVLTDAEGEWVITGPKGNDDPGYIRSIIGYLVPWIESPRIGYYKKGYFPHFTVLGGFAAYAYENKSENLEGIILYRMGDTEEEKRKFLDEWGDCHCYPFIPVKDPEKKLHMLDFDFRYPMFAKRVPSFSVRTLYGVIGLKRAVTPEEKREARGLGLNGLYPKVRQPLLMKALENEPYSIEGRRYDDVQE